MCSWWDFSTYRLIYAGNTACLCFLLILLSRHPPPTICLAGGLLQTPKIMQSYPDLMWHQDAKKALLGIRLLLKQLLPCPGSHIKSDSWVASLCPQNLRWGLEAGCQRSNSTPLSTGEQDPNAYSLRGPPVPSPTSQTLLPPSPLLLEQPS